MFNVVTYQCYIAKHKLKLKNLLKVVKSDCINKKLCHNTLG